MEEGRVPGKLGGGMDRNGPRATAEMYNQATLLPNGRVLISGG